MPQSTVHFKGGEETQDGLYRGGRTGVGRGTGCDWAGIRVGWRRREEMGEVLDFAGIVARIELRDDGTWVIGEKKGKA